MMQSALGWAVKVSTLIERRVWLGLILAVVVAVQALYLAGQPVPPHSSHDGFSLVPQLQKLVEGRAPDDAAFGMFEGTWFPPVPPQDAAVGWMPWVERVLGNVRPHTWVDAPHPLAFAGAMSAIIPGAAWVPHAVLTAYFLALLVGLYLIGCRARSSRVGLIAAALGAGAPGLFGMSRYLETHLPLAAVATLVVAALMHLDGLRRWGLCLVTSLLVWSLTRTGEAAGEVVIGGLLVVGPGLVVLWTSRKGQSVGRWLVGFAVLILPCLMLADLPFLRASMESVTRAFADPAVQTDVAEKGGALGGEWTWRCAYLVLMFTDYLSPLLALFVPLSAWGLYRARGEGSVNQHVLLGAWLLVPLVALSWMQRKAGWYGIGLIPPVVVWMALGLDSLERSVGWVAKMAMGVAVLQLGLLSLTPSDAVPAGLAWVRQPIPVHDWRLRRVDLLRPVDTPAHRQLASDVDDLVDWLDTHHPPTGAILPVAALVRGSGADYPLRYMVEIRRPDVVVLNLADPRARRIGYRGFHPDDFKVLLNVGDSLESWPLAPAAVDWLRAHLGCVEGDPIDPFLDAIVARGVTAAASQAAIYELGPPRGATLGPGRRWRDPGSMHSGLEHLCGW